MFETSKLEAPVVSQDPPKLLPGRLGNLTVAEQHTLENFKKELQDKGLFDPERHDDATLLRFLRARKFDLEQAKKMFVDCEKWREEFGTNNIITKFEFLEGPEVGKYYPQYYHKIDKDGRPVYIERLGKLDLKALYSLTTRERMLQRLVKEYEKLLTERLPACSAKVGYHVETSCTILDLRNVGLGQFYNIKDYVFQVSMIVQKYYPECMGKFYIINAPYLFSTVWSFIKPWLEEVTVAKTVILGKDYKEKLLEQIPAENLPEELGGTCKCEGDCSLANLGPWHKMSKEEVDEALKKIRNNRFPSAPAVSNVPKDFIAGKA